MMLEIPDLRLHDAAMHEEIELTSRLIIAASTSGRRLTASEIDLALGLDRP